jgi:hypothetical protein
MNYYVSFPEIKRPERGADPPTFLGSGPSMREAVRVPPLCASLAFSGTASFFLDFFFCTLLLVFVVMLCS